MNNNTERLRALVAKWRRCSYWAKEIDEPISAEVYRRIADELEKALSAGDGAAEGFVVVPREPTLEMESAWDQHYGNTFRGRYRAMLAAVPAAPAVEVDEVSGWINDGDTIPAPIIEACRQAIRREFGNNGTDGYYKRILVTVFRALTAALGREGGGNG